MHWLWITSITILILCVVILGFVWLKFSNKCCLRLKQHITRSKQPSEVIPAQVLNTCEIGLQVASSEDGLETAAIEAFSGEDAGRRVIPTGFVRHGQGVGDRL
jgi:hypothetical protein